MTTQPFFCTKRGWPSTPWVDLIGTVPGCNQQSSYIHKRHVLTILTGAAVHLERLLVGVNVKLDTRPRTRKRCNRSGLAPVEGAVLVAVDDVAVVVPGAVEAAVAVKLGRSVVGTNLLGRRPEVVDRVLLVRKDGTVWDEDVVNTNSLTRVRQVESVVQRKGCVRVREAVQVPVSLYTLVFSLAVACIKLTWEVSMMGVFLVVAMATILIFQVFGDIV